MRASYRVSDMKYWKISETFELLKLKISHKNMRICYENYFEKLKSSIFTELPYNAENFPQNCIIYFRNLSQASAILEKVKKELLKCARKLSINVQKSTKIFE